MTPTPAVSAKEKAREITQSPLDIAMDALFDVRRAIFNADPKVLTDTLWMPEDTYKGGTVVDFIENAMERVRALSATEGEAEPVVLPLPADKELPPITDRGFAGQIMDVAWPHYGGNHQTAEFWNDFGEGVRFALHYASPPSAPAGVKVKLEWRSDGSRGDRATTAFGDAVVFAGADGYFVWRLGHFDSGTERNEADAKKMLWATYESRIRSSLQPDTQAVDASGSVTLTRQQIDGLLRAAYPLATASERAGALKAVQPDTPAEALPAGVEEIARVIDPDAFDDWQRSYDHEIKLSGNEAAAKRFADWSAGNQCSRARDKASAVLAALSSAPAQEGRE